MKARAATILDDLFIMAMQPQRRRGIEKILCASAPLR
jgi:hypothetical protein